MEKLSCKELGINVEYNMSEEDKYEFLYSLSALNVLEIVRDAPNAKNARKRILKNICSILAKSISGVDITNLNQELCDRLMGENEK